MIQKLLISCIALLTPFLHLSANITETNEVSEIKSTITNDSIVFFNVTGTLYEPATTLADNQWRIYFADKVNSLVTDKIAAEKLINKIKNQIVNNVPKKVVEETTPPLIADLQNQQIPVLGITGKKMKTPFADNFGQITNNHLLSLKINLENTLTFLPVEAHETENYSFAYGMIFTNGNPDGPVLLAFLQQLPEKPEQVIMIDNSKNALKGVEEALAPIGIKFEGFRYGRSDARKANFDATLGTIQFFAFIQNREIMSDEGALKIKQNNPETNYDSVLHDYILQAVKDVN